MPIDIDTVVVGAGVVGLACARALAQTGLEVLILEEEDRPGEGISSRNSGVIHAGMYYPTGSLKARCCVRGLELLYALCAQRGIAHRRCGKLIVATREEDVPALRVIEIRAAANGVELHWLERAQALRLEPALRCVAALDSPNTGIVDVPELVTALLGEFEAHGGRLVCRTRAQAVRCANGEFSVETADGPLRCRRLVNAAGLGAIALAQRIDALPAATLPPQRYGQGHYYYARGKVPFARLIYPLPGAASLGVHLGMDITGRCRFGPDMRWVETVDYRFDDSRRGEFAASVRQWWPALRDEDLLPDFVGVRPKIHGPAEPAADFLVQGPGVHGIDGLVNLLGIESPGLTSCLALAEEVVRELGVGAG
ncbi:MAG: NAD(P)/FAD-dependent oxidoreductase [Xanthomonadales bacterium]|nr:L-2-hydroxyglutarate oxidase LhgO [Xanthomonadales bacterium]MCC6591925.1 NAD(P)/FAD-dependent oxidoreductase [Xanthomonadales bacterium]MCE7930067.1 NAD(P)/FAD-dependent oxidoreductase [Xanthomonadales bacterium PRO6]